MAKANKKCADCVLCETNPYGLTHCRLYETTAQIIFPENRACKMITGPVNLRKGKTAEPQPGDAPFCGNYPKCNNAEGCPCADYEDWVERIENLGMKIENKRGGAC